MSLSSVLSDLYGCTLRSPIQIISIFDCVVVLRIIA
jgi:hypothetical protein